jgi:phospholipid/cholesterol/gamma-HCH transport system permease protein
MALQIEQAEKPVLSKRADRLLLGIFEPVQFSFLFFKELFGSRFEFHELVRQCYQVGYKSLSLITLTGFIIGMVFTKQSRPALEDFGATSWLPSLIGIAVIRALAPLITSLICAGKVGSQIGAELGSMRVTEQIDAMEVAAVNPFNFLVVTRVLATTIMVPLLMLYAGFVALVGSFIDVHLTEQTNLVIFYQNAFSGIGFADVGSAVFRSLVFGFTIGMVGSYKGYNATHGTEGVGRAANTSVVVSMFLVFIENFFMVQVFNLL